MSPRPAGSRPARVRSRLVLGGLALGLTAATVSMLPGSGAQLSAGAQPVGRAAATAATVSDGAAVCAEPTNAGARIRPKAGQRHDANELSSAQVAGVERAATLQAAARGLHPTSTGRLARSSSTKAAFKPVTVSVYWHTITDGKAGKISSATIAKQISVLNAAYKPAGFSFKLVKTETTTNKDWFSTTAPVEDEVDGDAKDARAMKTKLHKGTRTALNIYTVKFSDDTLGYSSFPFSGLVSLDGTVLDYRSLPGGAYTGYNLGDTATHEVGHWMGLYHTFQGGCSATRGDYVTDTPAEAYPAFDCDARDTCASLPGNDPVKNFMDYAEDACMNTFTKGQNTRMQNKWLTYRAVKA